MNIELKNVKYAAFASEETPCYQATIYIDGKKRGTVSNDGHGGCDDFHPWELKKEIDAYAKTLPEWQSDYDGKSYPMDAEMLMARLLDRVLTERSIKDIMRKRVLFTKNGKLMQTKPISKARLDALLAEGKPSLARQLELGADDAILNLLPIGEATDLYTAIAEEVRS